MSKKRAVRERCRPRSQGAGRGWGTGRGVGRPEGGEGGLGGRCGENIPAEGAPLRREAQWVLETPSLPSSSPPRSPPHGGVNPTPTPSQGDLVWRRAMLLACGLSFRSSLSCSGSSFTTHACPGSSSSCLFSPPSRCAGHPQLPRHLHPSPGFGECHPSRLLLLTPVPSPRQHIPPWMAPGVRLTGVRRIHCVSPHCVLQTHVCVTATPLHPIGLLNPSQSSLSPSPVPLGSVTSVLIQASPAPICSLRAEEEIFHNPLWV